MTFRRPPAIPDQYMKLPLPQDYNNFLVASSSRDSCEEASTAFFNTTITLFRLTWKIIDSCYGGNLGCDKALGVLEVLPRVFQLGKELLDWKCARPADLALRRCEGLPTEGADHHRCALERFAVVLTLRYLNARVLLHRPVLVKILKISSRHEAEHQESALLHQIGLSSLQIYMESSMEVIALTKTIVHFADLRRTILGSYWSTLYYTFNAALVLFASCLVYRNGTINIALLSYSEERIRESLSEVLEALRLLDKSNRIVKLYEEYLERLVNLLDTQVSINDARTSQDNHDSVVASASHQQFLEPDFASSVMANQTDQSAFGLDFAEFMVEGELDFLNTLPAPNTTEKISSRRLPQSWY